MKVTVKFNGQELTGQLVDKSQTHTTIRVKTASKGQMRVNAIKPYSKDQYSQFSVLNENVISTETESVKETAKALNKLFGC